MTNLPQASERQYKVAEQIKKVISLFFQKGKFKAVDVGSFVTISEVRISPDLRNASIYASQLGGCKDEKQFISKLNLLVPEIRKFLAANTKLRFCPNLYFRYDDLFDKARHIEDIFQTIKFDDEKV